MHSPPKSWGTVLGHFLTGPVPKTSILTTPSRLPKSQVVASAYGRPARSRYLTSQSTSRFTNLTNLMAGSELLHVPPSALLHPDRLPSIFNKRLRAAGATVHCRLASFLTASSEADLEHLVGTWRNTWPSADDFAKTMPIMLPPEIRWPPSGEQSWLLPPQIASRHRLPGTFGNSDDREEHFGLLAEQEARLEKDWKAFNAGRLMEKPDWDRFVYCWLIVNSRCFYFDHGSLAKEPVTSQRMTMCPFVDLFNHADQGVGSSSSAIDVRD